MLLFLQLYLAHLVADFVFQPNWIARRKSEIGPLSVHAGIHVVCAVLAVNLGLNGRVGAAIGAVALIHIVIDLAKARLFRDGWLPFVADQAAHLAVVAAASVWATASGAAAVAALRAAAEDPVVYLYGAAYVAVVFGGGYLVQKITQSFLAKIQTDITRLKPGLPDAGKYIGWVERILILTFVIGGYENAVGFLLAVKALVRYPEIQEDSKSHFAEYFLLGTLTSVGLALATGLVVNRLKAFLT